VFICQIDVLTAEQMKTSSVVGYYSLTVCVNLTEISEQPATSVFTDQMQILNLEHGGSNKSTDRYDVVFHMS
jgi:hypothetical protein